MLEMLKPVMEKVAVVVGGVLIAHALEKMFSSGVAVAKARKAAASEEVI